MELYEYNSSKNHAKLLNIDFIFKLLRLLTTHNELFLLRTLTRGHFVQRWEKF